MTTQAIMMQMTMTDDDTSDHYAYDDNDDNTNDHDADDDYR